MICVEKKGKEHHYTLEQEDKPLFRFMHRDSPGLLNPTSKIVQGMMKKMSGNAKTKTEDGDVIEVPDGRIVDKIMQCFTWLDDLLIAYEDKKEDLKAEMLAEEQDKRLEELSKESEKFQEFLENNHATLMDYVWYATTWIAAGESQNILKGFFTHLSTIFKIKALWFFSLGKSGEGKSVIDDGACFLIPPNKIRDGDMSPAAMQRLTQKYGNDYLDGIVLRMRDKGGEHDFEKWEDTINVYKQLTTDGYAPKTVVGESTDEETGERSVLELSLEGHPGLSGSSVKEIKDEQIQSRVISAAPVATDEEVRKFSYYNTGLIKEKREHIIEEEFKMLHEYIEYVLEYFGDAEVINPYHICLDKWFSSSEFYKRATTTYPGLVNAVTLFNCISRESISKDDKLYFISTRGDNELVAKLFNPSQGLSEPAIRIFNLILEKYNPFNPDELDEYLTDSKYKLRDCNTIFSISEIKHHAIKRKQLKGLAYGDIFSSLMSNGLIEAVDKVRRSNNNVYILSHFEPLTHTHINFDKKLIERRVNDTEMLYGVSPRAIFEIIDLENQVTDGEPVDCDLKIAPWFSGWPDDGRGWPQKASSRSRMAVDGLKTQQKTITNRDKSGDLVTSATKRWGAFS